MQEQKDYYTILEVPRGASPEDIKRAWRRLAHKFHPDKAQGDEQKFKEINEAYYVLSDPQRRSQYDQFGTAFSGASRPDGFDYAGSSPFTEGFEDWFSEIFESFFGGLERGRRKRGKDAHVELEIPFERAFLGSDEEIALDMFRPCSRCQGTGGEPGSSKIVCRACKGVGRLHRVEQTFFGSLTRLVACPECHGRREIPETPCTTCKGSGREKRTERIRIHIPAGVESGDTLRVAGAGEAGAQGAPAGDLYVTVRVFAHERFRRQEDDLYCEQGISFPIATLGGSVRVQLPDGAVRLKIPQGTPSGHLFRIRDRGFPRRSGRGRGDALVRVEVRVPKKLSVRAKKAIEEIREELESE